MSETNALTETPPTALQSISPLPVAELKRQLMAVEEYIKGILVEKIDFMKIPGCPKPSLLQPGAEKIALGFNLGRKTEITKTDLGNDHREYMARVVLFDRVSGLTIGEGIGACSTLEPKYRYYKDKSERTDIAGEWHTCMLMSEKRAFVNAMKCIGAVSGRFTMDMEDRPQRAKEDRKATGPPAGSPTKERAINEAQKKRAMAIGYAKGAGLGFGDVERLCKHLHGCKVADLTIPKYEAFCATLEDTAGAKVILTAIQDAKAPAKATATPAPLFSVNEPRDDEAPPEQEFDF